MSSDTIMRLKKDIVNKPRDYRKIVLFQPVPARRISITNATKFVEQTNQHFSLDFLIEIFNLQR